MTVIFNSQRIVYDCVPQNPIRIYCCNRINECFETNRCFKQWLAAAKFNHRQGRGMTSSSKFDL